MEEVLVRETEIAAAAESGERKAGEGEGRPALLEVLGSRDFRLRLIGGGISVLGDQFYLIALPWLVLQLAGNALAMGTVLALAGIPRALFMLVGGALTDRFSPRTVMLASNLLRSALIALLAALVLTGSIALWMLYGFALAFGLVDAFFYPAAMAILPQIVEKKHLQVGNALNQGVTQIGMFVGPVLAGILIAVLDGGGHGAGQGPAVPDRLGIGIAFLIDAVGFLASALTLWLMKSGGKGAGKEAEEAGVFAAIREGLATVWNDGALRIFFAVVAAINLLVSGPIMVGIPVLANSRLPEGAAAFGIIMSAYGGGTLLGIALGGMLPKPAPQRMGLQLLAAAGTLGLELPLLGLTSSTTFVALINAAAGVAGGYAMILFITWLQNRTAPEMLGRMMSLLMFASIGLFPVSSAAAGALLDLNVTLLFVLAGALLVVVVLAAALSPSARALGAEQGETASAPAA